MEAEEWHIPLSQSEKTLKECLSSMEPIALEQSDIPLIIKLIENPKYDIGLFAGYVDLFSHDTIHILVGRGLMLKDEAFVIGYTMGSSKKMRRWRRNLFYFCAKYFYPEGYNFTEEERFVFYSGVMAGSRCASDLSKVQFKKLVNMRIGDIRRLLGIDEELLKCYYCTEKKLFDAVESQRLI
tara:strand:+ start:8416 stop:8961 length:546 start_codon:yes stop_codon:yes gene_type:complete